ncbi:MAG: YbaB/EbfC family nucleoid-associated protein [Bacteroidetes bacterium]|nr:YbaB/EbfC family nucleoid-associated protein [Bacteroidota bacterium]
MFKMLGKLNELKTEAAQIKQDLKTLEVEGKSASGRVKVTATADKHVHGVWIDSDLAGWANATALQEEVLEATQMALKQAAHLAKETIRARINEKFPEVAGMGLDQWLG